MKQTVLVNVEDKDIRVAVLEDNQLTQLFVEPVEKKSIVGNIYKGRVDSVVPGLKAVFVDIGLERNAFLHFQDVHDAYTLPGRSGHPGEERRKRNSRKKDDGESKKQKSQELRPGDEILVQAVKEPMGTKGARLTSYISLPGRFLVLLPFSSENGGGVSRRIENGSERNRLRKILKDLKADEGSFIVRTAGLERDEEEIVADVKKTQKLWTRIKRSAAQKKPPALVHDDHDIIGRIVRDELTGREDQIYVDSKEYARELKKILTSLIPDLKKKVVEVNGMEQNLFEKYEVEQQFQKALRRKVWTKSGAYIVIDETEALVAIDVNSGKFVGKGGDQEEMIFKTNMEAAETVAAQLRLRDMGGIIVVDFIDMRSRENQRKLENRFNELLKKDRAKTTVSSLSDYGLLEMTRKRVRQSLSKTIFNQCPYCGGSGRVLSERLIWKSMKYDILKILQEQPNTDTLQITLHPHLRRYLENEMLEAAKGLANHGSVSLNFVDDRTYHLEQYDVIKVK